MESNYIFPLSFLKQGEVHRRGESCHILAHNALCLKSHSALFPVCSSLVWEHQKPLNAAS